METEFNIYVVFDDEGLKRADEVRNQELKTFCNSAGHKWDQRVSYQCNMNLKSCKSKHVYIIDESDARQFRNLDEFYTKTSKPNVVTICLTATPYEGHQHNLEKSVIDAIGQ